MAKSLDNLDIVKSLDNSYILVDRDGELRKIKVGVTGQGGVNLQTIPVRINSNTITEIHTWDFQTMTISNTTTIPSTVDCPIFYRIFQSPAEPTDMYYDYIVLFGFQNDGSGLSIVDSNNNEVYNDWILMGLDSSYSEPITLPEYIEINDVQQGDSMS